MQLLELFHILLPLVGIPVEDGEIYLHWRFVLGPCRQEIQGENEEYEEVFHDV
tara:strand:- start:583 stop:741 length:159 start_codon:yes stop_codon:yes gene_type:complete